LRTLEPLLEVRVRRHHPSQRATAGLIWRNRFVHQELLERPAHDDDSVLLHFEAERKAHGIVLAPAPLLGQAVSVGQVIAAGVRVDLKDADTQQVGGDDDRIAVESVLNARACARAVARLRVYSLVHVGLGACLLISANVLLNQ
jgi:hypothetical protein